MKMRSASVVGVREEVNRRRYANGAALLCLISTDPDRAGMIKLVTTN